MSIIVPFIFGSGDDLHIVLFGDINDRKCVFVVAETNLVILISNKKNI